MADDILYCPKYDKSLKTMIAEKDNAKTNIEKLKILKNFASKFTLLPEQLLEFDRFYMRKFVLDNYSALYSISYGDRNAKHIQWLNKNSVIDKLCDNTCKNRFEVTDEALTFPHHALEDLCKKRLFYSVAPMPKMIKKKYKQSKKIFEKIKKCENDIEKWIECMKEIKDKDVIIANLELKIGQDSNWKNKKLWKFYFDFLRENNMKEILESLRKYTRLFICDKQAVKYYRKELDKFSSWNIPTTKYWIDTIKYEIHFGKLSSSYRILERALKAVIGKIYHFEIKDENDLLEKLEKYEYEMIEIEKLRNSVKISKNIVETTAKPTVHFQNPKLQYTCFHQSFIQNLLKNGNGKTLRKLYSTCKFFYSYKKAPLCYRLEICSSKKTCYCQESLYVNEEDLNFVGLNNLQIYGLLYAENCTNRNSLSQILPKLKFCAVEYIFLQNQDLIISEFQMLLSKWLIQIFCQNVEIKIDENDDIDAKQLMDIINPYRGIRCIEILTDKLFICRVDEYPEWSKPWLPFSSAFHLEEIYIEKQSYSIFDLQKFINYSSLKNITLKSVAVKEENGTEIGKQKLEEFIKAEVNPENNVCIEIS